MRKNTLSQGISQVLYFIRMCFKPESPYPPPIFLLTYVWFRKSYSAGTKRYGLLLF